MQTYKELSNEVIGVTEQNAVENIVRRLHAKVKWKRQNKINKLTFTLSLDCGFGWSRFIMLFMVSSRWHSLHRTSQQCRR